VPHEFRDDLGAHFLRFVEAVHQRMAEVVPTPHLDADADLRGATPIYFS